MTQEFETQILDTDVEAVKNRLRELGAAEEPEVMQKRWVFDIKCLNSEVPGTGTWIRLRQTGHKATLTYKNKQGSGISETEEIEVTVDDFDKTAELLSKLPAFDGKNYQENKRQRFMLNDIEVTVNTWPRIPPIIEIEAENEQKVQEGLRLLGLEGKDAGHIGWIEIYKRYGIDLQSYLQLKF